MKKTLIISFLFLFSCDAGLGIFHSHSRGLCIEYTQYGNSSADQTCDDNTTQAKCVSEEASAGYSSRYSYWVATNMDCDQWENE